MYIPDLFLYALIVLLIVSLILNMHLFLTRDFARQLAESMQRRLRERPVQRIVYSDDVIESKIIDMCEHNELFGVAGMITRKEYLK